MLPLLDVVLAARVTARRIGVVQVLVSERRGDGAPVFAVVGPMQFEVASHRMEHEFGLTLNVEDIPGNSGDLSSSDLQDQLTVGALEDFVKYWEISRFAQPRLEIAAWADVIPALPDDADDANGKLEELAIEVEAALDAIDPYVTTPAVKKRVTTAHARIELRQVPGREDLQHFRRGFANARKHYRRSGPAVHTQHAFQFATGNDVEAAACPREDLQDAER